MRVKPGKRAFNPSSSEELDGTQGQLRRKEEESMTTRKSNLEKKYSRGDHAVTEKGVCGVGGTFPRRESEDKLLLLK